MTIAVVFFDIGDTLGAPRPSPSGEPISLEVFPYVPDVLARLQQEGLRLGVISNTGDIPGAKIRAMLGTAGLLDAFEAQLLLFSADLGITKDDPAIFVRAAEIAGTATSRCIYVGEDPKERATAAGVGMAVCTHPLLALELCGDRLVQGPATAPDPRT